MANFDEIAASLRRQRKQIDDSLETSSSRGGRTAELVDRIEELRQRVEKSRRSFQDNGESAKKPA